MPSRPLRAGGDCGRAAAWVGGCGAAVWLLASPQSQAAGSELGGFLPEPLPPAVQRAEVHEALPAPRYYFDPPSARYHYGLRVGLGGGAQWQSDGAATPSGDFHLDISIAGRHPFMLARRSPGGYVQPASWSTVGYYYGYSPGDGNARNFFVGGLGLGLHFFSAAPPRRRDPDSGLYGKYDKDERPTTLALGWTPNILLGRTLGSFALGVRNVLSIEVVRHILGIHLSYDFIYVWQGAYIHDAAVSLSFDPLGFLRF